MALREHQRGLLVALPVWDHDRKRLSQQLALRPAHQSLNLTCFEPLSAPVGR